MDKKLEIYFTTGEFAKLCGVKNKPYFIMMKSAYSLLLLLKKMAIATIRIVNFTLLQ